jgi:hypothetical protein
MTNRHSGPSAAEEIYRILPVFVGLPTDEVTAAQDHLTVAVKKADTTELDRACSSAASASSIMSRSSRRSQASCRGQKKAPARRYSYRGDRMSRGSPRNSITTPPRKVAWCRAG